MGAGIRRGFYDGETFSLDRVEYGFQPPVPPDQALPEPVRLTGDHLAAKFLEDRAKYEESFYAYEENGEGIFRDKGLGLPVCESKNPDVATVHKGEGYAEGQEGLQKLDFRIEVRKAGKTQITIHRPGNELHEGSATLTISLDLVTPKKQKIVPFSGPEVWGSHGM